MKFFIVCACVLLSSQCGSLPVENAVVSVYTTQPTTVGTSGSLDVYHQIANNIAERITSPIYRFLGLNSTTTVAPKSTMKEPWDDFFDEHELPAAHDVKPVDNNLFKTRDVEELLPEGQWKNEKKPEKFTLYSNVQPARILLPILEDVTTAYNNPELNEIYDLHTPKPKEGLYMYALEFIGSILQLMWGGFMTVFKPIKPEWSS